MNYILEKLKPLILEKHGTVKNFAAKINIPYTTIANMFFHNSFPKADVLKMMCEELNISADSLLDLKNKKNDNLNFEEKEIIELMEKVKMDKEKYDILKNILKTWSNE